MDEDETVCACCLSFFFCLISYASLGVDIGRGLCLENHVYIHYLNYWLMSWKNLTVLSFTPFINLC